MSGAYLQVFKNLRLKIERASTGRGHISKILR